MIDQSVIAIEPYPGKNMRRFWIGCRLLRASCVIDTHIILVRIVRSTPGIQNSCIKYSTQGQHFAKMFTYSDNTNYNLNFYNFIVLI
jgi:hypothetical protein